MFGAEALLRWDSPALGKVGPDEFIFVAEETGLIFGLGDWVMKKSMQQITKWNTKFGDELIVSINISPIQIEDSKFIERVLELIAETGVSPKWINFEITESSTIESKDEFLSVLTRLSEIGISFAIDDFGTGYSTYGYLKRFPIDYLKIDKQLIDTITSVPKDARVVRAIIAMAKAFKIYSVAEGAETKEQVELLRRIGCNSVQGYYFGKPVSANEFEQKYFEELEVDEEIVNSH
jgi:EAL domain-containing protein (putative c-di-GMP-specific phosphodiesterase class I)